MAKSPFISNSVFCPVLGKLVFPLTPLTNTPVVLGAGSGAGPGVPVLTHPRGLHRDRAHRQGRTDLESCHTALQMWKCFSGRLKDFFFFSQTTYTHQYMANMHFKLICVCIAKYHNDLQLCGRRAHSLTFYCSVYFFLLYYQCISPHFALCL